MYVVNHASCVLSFHLSALAYMNVYAHACVHTCIHTRTLTYRWFNDSFLDVYKRILSGAETRIHAHGLCFLVHHVCPHSCNVLVVVSALALCFFNSFQIAMWMVRMQAAALLQIHPFAFQWQFQKNPCASLFQPRTFRVKLAGVSIQSGNEIDMLRRAWKCMRLTLQILHV